VLKRNVNAKPVPVPPHYEERNFLGSVPATIPQWEALKWPGKPYVSRMPLHVDTDYPEGTYSGNASVYTHRRLIDARHGYSKSGPEKVLLNFPVNDYPLDRYPKHVADKLGAAAGKNVVDMTAAERAVVFEDAKHHSLGYLHYLQKHSPEFAQMELTDEFGTPDRMPWKVYIREGLRLEAMYMLKEQDLKQQKEHQLGWARFLPQDNVFGFQFNIDFHPTRRSFLAGADGPWMAEQTETRNWSTHTDRGGFPYRALVPVEVDGLLGAGKNLGVSSIVSSAVRLHGQTMMAGQAAATAASICLRDKIQPRALAGDMDKVREMQLTLVRGSEGKPGVLLWPYHDLSPDDRHFEAANLLAVMGVMPGYEDSLDFQAWRVVTMAEVYDALLRAKLPFTAGRGEGKREATWRDLYDLLKQAGMKPSEGLAKVDYRVGNQSPPLYRFELALHLWHVLKPR
jgi:FAD dependent oxidoreductase